jgi:FtsP/CotA-like multicopper oxidase with cupredoxin domain
MEGGAMGSLAQAMHEGEMKDIRSLVGEGMAWSLNGVAGMPEAPLFTAARGRTIAVDLRNDTRWPHAIHLHGHHFRVLERDGQPAEMEAWKDTVLLDPQKRAKIAFVADNPGKWMIHCHMLEHQASGMTSWFVVEA